MLESSIGYDKGCKYDKGYGYARSYDTEYERCDDDAEYERREKEWAEREEKEANEFYENPRVFEEAEECKEKKDLTKCDTEEAKLECDRH